VSESSIRIVIELGDEEIERIAERVAAIATARSQPAETASPYMTVPEAAAYLRCRRQRIDDLLSQGRLGRVKDGGRTLIARAELDAYLGRGAGASLLQALPSSPSASGALTSGGSSRKFGSGRSSGTRWT